MVANVAAFADPVEEPAAPAPAYDYPLTVTGLSTGDTVKFYQVVEWVGETADNSDVSGWKAVSPYSNYLTKAVLTSILVGNPNAEPAVEPTGITSEISGELVRLISGDGETGNVSGGTATLNNPEAGLWMAIVTPADANTIYNPVFVAADYNTTTGGTVAMTAAYSDAVAKKSTVTLTKTADNAADYTGDHAQTTAIGDTVTFTVTTTIPGYGNIYEHPHFDVVDSLVDLTLNLGSVTVTSPAAEKGTDYTVTAEGTGYRLSFGENYLKTIQSATSVTITYTAVVATTAAKAINEEDNDVYIEYSHTPTDEDDYDVKKDTTQHYTFTLDAAGLGAGQTVSGLKTSELVKVGLDAAGNPILTETQTSAITNTESWEGPLQGARFGLWKNATCTGDAYLEADTGADGRMTFTGLDAGIYYLKEISAPAGYVTQTAIHTIVISAELEPIEVTEWWNGSTWVSTEPASGTKKEVTYTTEILKSYSVTVDDVPTATYTFTNDTTTDNNDIQWTVLDPEEKPFTLENINGTELPSTGGMGTTILYVGGSILVILAAVLLITKRRMSADE